MSASTKLSNSVKALCFLAETYPEPQSSVYISSKIGVNASKLRKLLSLLAKNNIVESVKGTNGGFILKKAPKKIHLQEIYCSIEDRKAFHLHVNEESGNSKNLSQKFNDYFLGLFADVQVDIEKKMMKISLDSILEKIGINSAYKN